MLQLKGTHSRLRERILGGCFLLAACLLHVCMGTSEPLMPTNAAGVPDPLAATFRMNKITVVWQKAIRTLDESLLPSLYAELVVQDRLEVELKKSVTEGGDEDGTQEDILRRKFLNILRQFGLHDLYGVVNTKRSGDGPSPADPLGRGPLDPRGPGPLDLSDLGPLDPEGLEAALGRDDRLAKLWAKAEMAGFSGSELDGLRSEFAHHARKQTEYELLKRDIERLERQSDNSIERRVRGGGPEEEEALRAKHAELKRVYRELMAGYDLLDQRTNNDPLPTSDFEDTRIRELYLMAAKSNMTATELASFREELGHFQKRINKQEFYVKEAEKVKAEMARLGSDDYPPAYEDLAAKAQEHTSKIKKWYAELKTRVLRTDQVHREL